jgi:hypothetical protein
LFDANNPKLVASQPINLQNENVDPKESEFQHRETYRI